MATTTYSESDSFDEIGSRPTSHTAPSRAVNDSRRRTKLLIIYDRRGFGNVPRWMATLSLASSLLNSRRKTADYAITRLKIIPSARETEALRRRKGRCRRKRNQVLREIQQKDAYGKPPTRYELRGEVKALREQTNYDTAQEYNKNQAKIRKSKYTAYEKRQEARRQEQKPH